MRALPGEQGAPGGRSQPGLGACGLMAMWAGLGLCTTAATAGTGGGNGTLGAPAAREEAPLRPATKGAREGGAVTGGPAALVSSGLIQSALLDPAVPLFVPTHPRVTTTLRFPGAIGAPEGRGFTEDEARSPGEYLVAWTRGDPHLTVTPLAGAAALNLNIPYEGNTYVVYFYPVERQFQALASLRFLRPGTEPLPAGMQKPGGQALPPARPGVIEPVALLGLLDKIKLLRAVAPGNAQRKLAATLGVELHCPERNPESETRRPEKAESVVCEITHVARDPSLGLLAFVLRLRNPLERAETLTGAEMAVLCGSSRLCGRLLDAPELLSPGEEAEAFLLARQDPLAPLSAANTWHARLVIPWPRLGGSEAAGSDGGAGPENRKGCGREEWSDEGSRP